jgi:serine protease
MYIFHFDGQSELQAIISDFSADAHIEFAERYSIPDPCYTPNDPDIAQQWHLATTHAYQAWDTVRGDTTRHAIIGIVDTGVYWDHHDLAANIWVNENEDINHNGVFDDDDENGIDNDNNGYIDDVIGWDFGGPDNNPAENMPWHGTAVAGCASEGTDNGAKGASIGYSARLMCAKATNYQNDLVYCYQGITYAADNGADIINCSWGSPGYSRANQNIINHVYSMGVSVIASSGGTSNIIYPGGYDHVVAVGSTDENDHIPGFSDGDSLIDIYAPGTNILTTWNHNTMIRMDGTSLSSPIVCGLAALIMSWHPEYTPDQIEETIETSADSIGYLNPSHPNAIRINCNNWLLTGINDAPNSALDRFTLLENYPNPFNAQTEIRFVLPAEGEVNIALYDIMGRRVKNYDCGSLPAGYNAVKIDGNGKSSGVYIYQVNAGAFSESRKCLLLK